MKYSQLPTNISGIYKINFPNKKIYIGRSINIKKRIAEHFNKEDNTPCHFAIKKYYKSHKDMDVDILQVVEKYDDSIFEMESKWINLYNSTDKNIGYNVTSGGDGGGTGVFNTASKLTQDILDDIINRLKNGESNISIGQLYSLHPDTVGRINQGKTYFNPKLVYPIREKYTIKYQDKYNSITKEQFDTIVKLLTTTKLPYKTIAEITHVSKSTVTNINTGNHYFCKNSAIDFPIRKSGRSVQLTNEKLGKIKELLLNPNYSMEEIGKLFYCSYNTISDINLGKRYRDKNTNYPIRTFYPKRKTKKSVSTIHESVE